MLLKMIYFIKENITNIMKVVTFFLNVILKKNEIKSV
jgi:hypothetical protein